MTARQVIVINSSNTAAGAELLKQAKNRTPRFPGCYESTCNALESMHRRWFVEVFILCSDEEEMTPRYKISISFSTSLLQTSSCVRILDVFDEG
jgi:hypothetical protein